MPEFCVGKLARALNSRRKPLNGSGILVIGVAYKPDVNDMRESPALKVIDLLIAEGAEVSYHDPHVSALVTRGLRSVDMTEQALGQADAVAVVTNHSGIDWDLVARASQLVVDFRNVVPEVDGKVWRL
jgi:UDP-N-acetyl-D-glucosamine dehydrogenase